jgi:hypothetical protein
MPNNRAPKPTADIVLYYVSQLSATELTRLGMELARRDSLQPKWRVVRRRDSAVITPEGLSGTQARLYFYVSGGRREHDVIYHLWPADANASPDVGRDKTLCGRVRKLQFDTNHNLRLFKHPFQIARSRDHYLCIVRDQD